MKRVFFWIVALSMACQVSAETPLKVMTFNIRMNNSGDGINSWPHRKDAAAQMVKHYAPDVIGTQEVLHLQLTDMDERLPNYSPIGVGREDGKTKGEYAAVWYNTDKFELLDSGNFWLSETPEVAGSKGWDGACERIATWVKLRDLKTNETFFFMNTHLDHVGKQARSEGVKLILDRAIEYSNGLPIIVTGDFNSTPDSDVVAHMTNAADKSHLTDSRNIAKNKEGEEWSFHDFGKIPQNDRPLLDYIFVSDGIVVNSHSVLPAKYNGRFVSDHSPVMATMVIKP